MNKRRQQVLIWSIGMLVTAVMLGLGLWQMESFRHQGQEALIARMNEPAVQLADVAPVGEMPTDGYGRMVEAHGTYLPEEQLLVPDHRDPSSFRVLTALELADGSIVPVVRGEARGTPSPPPAGPLTQRGILLPTEGEPETELPEGQIASVRLARIAQIWSQPMVSGFIVLDAPDAQAQNLAPAQVELPSNAGHARSQGYALQWWIFAAAAIAATIKLSRDAATGTGFMALSTETVDDPGETVENHGEVSTTGPAGPILAGESEPTTVDKPPVG
ncbi:MAG: SURF1 family protein [Propionibacteriaceae bacterium]|nr:SURF1 family protein [Propionibacteriaceae bacterium]